MTRSGTCIRDEQGSSWELPTHPAGTCPPSVRTSDAGVRPFVQQSEVRLSLSDKYLKSQPSEFLADPAGLASFWVWPYQNTVVRAGRNGPDKCR